MSLLRHSWRLLQASAESGAASRCCRSFRYQAGLRRLASIAYSGHCLCCDQTKCTLSRVSAAVRPLRPQEGQEQHQHLVLAALPMVQAPEEPQAAQVLGGPQAHILVGQADCSKISSPLLQSKQLRHPKLPASLEQQCEPYPRLEMQHC